jgi:hypothetical protein
MKSLVSLLLLVTATACSSDSSDDSGGNGKADTDQSRRDDGCVADIEAHLAARAAVTKTEMVETKVLYGGNRSLGSVVLARFADNTDWIGFGSINDDQVCQVHSHVMAAGAVAATLDEAAAKAVLPAKGCVEMIEADVKNTALAINETAEVIGSVPLYGPLLSLQEQTLFGAVLTRVSDDTEPSDYVVFYAPKDCSRKAMKMVGTGSLPEIRGL